MNRKACSFKQSALNTLGRNCAFLPPARLSWTHPASRLLHSEVLFEYSLLLSVGMDSAPLKPQPQSQFFSIIHGHSFLLALFPPFRTNLFPQHSVPGTAVPLYLQLV